MCESRNRWAAALGSPIIAIREETSALGEDKQLREALDLIPDGEGYGQWWGTPEGQWLYRRIEDRIGVHVVRWAARVYGPRYDSLDVANTAVETLASPQVRTALIRSTDQWAYLAAILKRALIGQVGAFFRDESLGTTEDEPAADSGVAGLTPILDAIQLTAEYLRPYTPNELLPHLEEVVYYFAERGHTNLSYLHSNASRDPELLNLGLRPGEIRAIANAVLGARPHHGDESLLGGFLRDGAFDPSESAEHTAALNKYASRLSARNVARELIAS